MKITINPKLAEGMLKQVIPQYDELISELESNDEILPMMAQFAQKTGLSGYPLLYLDKQNVVKLILATLMPVDQINSLNDFIKTLSQEEADDFANQAVKNLNQSPEKLEAILDSSMPGTLCDLDSIQLSGQAQIAFMTILVCVHDIISFLVHGRRITDLVESAMEGDDEAFCLAVQIDRSILSLPYFRDKLQKAFEMKTKEDAQFIYNLTYRMQNPVMRGRIKQRQAWIALLMLDYMNLLDGTLTRSELLLMFDNAGIEGIGSEDNLSRMLRNFRSYQNNS